MANVDWMIKGPSVSTCNCAWGCPCQFNALPTQGNCRAAVAMRIDQGHFGTTRLDGLKWLSMAAWPGAIHEGHGAIQAVLDERADESQRTALITILSGKETEPGATIFSVLLSTVDTIHTPLFRPIRFEADPAARIAKFSVAGLVEAEVEPIRNPVTGAPHRARVSLPGGFEYREAEFASSTTKAADPIPLDWASRHAHLAILHLGPNGPLS